MTFDSLLVANRGEIAIRITRAAQDLGLRTIAVYTSDDADSLHTRVADEAYELPGTGARGYLDVAAMIEAARSTGAHGHALADQSARRGFHVRHHHR